MKKWLLSIFLVLAFVLLILPFLIPLPGGAGLPAEDVAPPEGRLITVNGVQTYVEEGGPVDGPAVVLIHGFGGSTFSWRDTLPALGAAGYRVVALDLKGFGLSEKRFEEDYSHPAQATFAAGVMDALDIESATLVGHSMGGNVVAHMALTLPERVESLVIVDGAVVQPGEPGRQFAGAGLLTQFPPTRRWLRLGLRLAFNRERFASLLQSAAYDPAFVTDEVVAGYSRAQSVTDWDLALLGIVRNSARNTLPSPFSAIEAPVLFVWGEEDTWVPLAAGQDLQSTLPSAELIVIPEAGHLPMEEKPEQFNEILLAFLAQQEEQ